MILTKDGKLLLKAKYIKREKTKEGKYRYYYKDDPPQKKERQDLEREDLIDKQEKERYKIKNMSKEEINELKNNSTKMGKFLMDNQPLWQKIAHSKKIRSNEIEDATQEMMIKVFEGVNKMDKLTHKKGQSVGHAFYNYVSKIANNAAINYREKSSYKKKGKEVYFEEKKTDQIDKQDTEDYLKEVAIKEHKEKTEKKELTDTFRTIIKLVEKDLTKTEKDVLGFIRQGFKTQKISETLKRTSQAITNIKRKLKEKMQDIVNKYAITKSAFLTLEQVEFLEKSFDIVFPKRLEDELIKSFDLLPILKGGEWRYLLKGKKNLPVGTKRVHNGVTMVKQPDKTWKPEKKGEKVKKEKPEKKEKKEKKEKEDKPKFSSDTKGKIKAFMQKFLDFIGDIFTSQDVGVGQAVETVKEVSEGVSEKQKEKKEVKKKSNDNKANEEQRKNQVKENIKKEKEKN